MRAGALHGPDEAGFTLVEMLVAMLLLSLVGLTLARFQTFQLAGAASLATVAAARLEADNRAVALLVDPVAPTAPVSGTSSNVGRRWIWTASPGPSPDPARLPEFVTLAIKVAATTDGPTLAERTVVRPRVRQRDSQADTARRRPPPA